MTNQQTVSNKRYLITPSLLNAWGYMWTCIDGVVEAESDEISLEDKQEQARAKARESFMQALNRLPSEPNQFMQAGIDFEKECYEGTTCVSPIIEGGCYQVVGMKDVTVDGIDFLMYGRLDVLKAGVIYDIKRIWKYSMPKYAKSYQHGFYMDLFPNAYRFEYLAYDGYRLHREAYFPNGYEPTTSVISRFIKWLKNENLLQIYLEKWEAIK